MDSARRGIFFQCLKDCFGQNWHENLESNSGFLEYKLLFFFFLNGLEECTSPMNGNVRTALIIFRAGVSWVKMHKLCFTPGSQFSCPLCPDQKEDKVHVLCDCIKYDDIRPDFLRRESLHLRIDPFH